MTFLPFRDLESAHRWILGYVGGRARAYLAGRQPLAALIGSIKMARDRGVSDDDIAARLEESGLSRDAVKASLTHISPGR
jgi:hypothetical protein